MHPLRFEGDLKWFSLKFAGLRNYEDGKHKVVKEVFIRLPGINGQSANLPIEILYFELTQLFS